MATGKSTLLAALAEHLAAQLDLAPPEWSRSRVLAAPWFPSSLRSKRMEAPVWAPAAFRKHGVYLSAETSTPHDGGRRVQP